ncbi:MAG TPA: MFS transporter, partial [Gaiellaceae bacterium]|nr:MFS transporter [Gaiellaceae bacterium]
MVQGGGRRTRQRGIAGGRRLTPDARRLVAVQGTRALAYGLGSVLIGVTLAERGYSDAAVGVILASLLAGNALASVLLARHADRFGRRRSYRVLLVLMACAGAVFALTGSLPALIAAGLTGTLSTDVVESGPFTSLEQAMLPHASGDRDPTRVFGTYNTVATLAGSFGALIALVGFTPSLLLAYPLAALIGLAISAGLSSAVEVGHELEAEDHAPLHRSRGVVARMCGFFALDSFGGGFVPLTFIAYLFTRRYDASPETLAVLFFAIGLIQAVSFQVAVRVAGRIGLLRTMVFTHLPSNFLLIAVAFAPNLETAIALLVGRFALSQMDVPTRQAYVVGVVEPSERTAAAAYTNV